MIHDLAKCDLGDDASVVTNWAERNPNLIASTMSLFKNLFWHGLGMTSKAMFAVDNLKNARYYDFGHDCGWIVGRVLEDSNK